MNKNILVEIKDLEKSFITKNGKKEVHKKLSLNIYKNERLAIIGTNGAGKSVLVEMIASVLKQDSGTIKFNFDEGKNEFDEIGIQFQTMDEKNSLLKPKNLIHFYRKIYSTERVTNKNLDELIKIFDVEDLINKKMGELSGGQKQRINLLLAVMHNPELLILDEFTSGLDIISVIDILDFINKRQKETKTTMVIISHNPKEIKDLSDRIVLIKNGVIAKEFKTSVVNKKYKGDFEGFLIEQLRGNSNG